MKCRTKNNDVIINVNELQSTALMRLNNDIWKTIFAFLNIEDVTTLSLIPMGRDFSKAYIPRENDRQALLKIGLEYKFEEISKLIYKQHNALRSQYLAHKKNRTKIKILIGLSVLGIAIWQSAGRLFQWGVDMDNNYSSAVKTTKYIFNEIANICPAINDPNTYYINCPNLSLYTNPANDPKCCTPFALNSNCAYSLAECTYVVNIMMNCSSSLWSNYTANCQYQDNNSGAAFMVGFGVMVLLFLVGVSACIGGYWKYKHAGDDNVTLKENNEKINLNDGTFAEIKDSITSEHIVRRLIYRNRIHNSLGLNEIYARYDTIHKKCVNDPEIIMPTIMKNIEDQIALLERIPEPQPKALDHITEAELLDEKNDLEMQTKNNLLLLSLKDKQQKYYSVPRKRWSELPSSLFYKPSAKAVPKKKVTLRNYLRK